jgi:hypothetical protein
MNVPAKAEVSEKISFKNVPIAAHGGGGMLLPQTFGEVIGFSEIMARSQHAIPKHLRDVPGACLAVTMQALRWEMDPFAVAAKSYNVKDMIAYEAQLIAAVVLVRAPLTSAPVYEYSGEGATRRCTVSALFKDGVTRSYESPKFSDIKTKNSPLWVADPDQQLGYYSIRAFARRYCPEVILGVYTPEEAETFQGPDRARDVTPRTASVPFSTRISEIDHTPAEEIPASDEITTEVAASSEPLSSGSPHPAPSGKPESEKAPAAPAKAFPGDEKKASS